MKILRLTVLFFVLVLPVIARAADGLDRVQHIIVIYQENWSFDALYGRFPGANGLANATNTVAQVDIHGQPLNFLPQPLNEDQPDSHFPRTLPVQPYSLTNYISADQKTGDLIHRFYHEQLQIDNGVLEPRGNPMDKFVAWSDNGGLVLSYFDATDMPEGKLAQEFVMCDNFFHSSYGGSFLNHHFLIAATAPHWAQPIPASPKFVSRWDAGKKTLVDGNLTFDSNYVVNTTYSINSPHPATPADQLMQSINDNNPKLSYYTPTIGDRLLEKNISWKWYAGGWRQALNNHADPLFQFHHQPFAYYNNFADNTLLRKQCLVDEQNFLDDLQKQRLPAVSFVKFLGPDNEHPGYSDLAQGQQHVADVVSAIRKSPVWADCVIIITYDENGGRWDHVAPPKVDEWGLGTRVPTIIISPFAKRHFVDHTQYETVSILKFIEKRYHLAPLAARDQNPAVNDLLNAFDFNQ